MHVTSTCGLRTRITGVPGRLTTEQRPPKQRVEQGTSENESEALLFAQPSVVPLRTGPVLGLAGPRDNLGGGSPTGHTPQGRAACCSESKEQGGLGRALAWVQTPSLCPQS